MIARAKSVVTGSMVMFKTSNLRFKIVSGRTCLSRSYHQSWMVAPPVVYDRGSVVARLIVRSVARCYDLSYDRSFGAMIATIDRTIDRR